MATHVKAHKRRPPLRPGPKTVGVVEHTRPPTRGVKAKADPVVRSVYKPKRQPGAPKKPVKYATKQRKKARRGARKADLWWNKLIGG